MHIRQWENLEVTDWVRWLRCLVVYIAALLVLGVGFLVIIILTHNKTAASERVPDFTMCENEIPSLYTPDGVFPGTVTLEVPPWIDEARVMCSWAFPESNSFYGVYSFGASWSLPVAYYDVGACKDNPCPRPGASSYCPCLVSANDTAAAGFELPRCQTVGCLSDAPGRSCKSFPYEWIASCYCLQRLKSLMDNRFSLGWFTSLLNDHDLAMCKSVAQSLVYGALMQLALSLFTLAMSTFILPPAIKAITAWEKHRSADEEASQNLMRLFVAQFLNLAILLLIVYGGHPMVQQASEDPNSPLWARVLWTLGIFRGPYTEMDSGWYSVVGTQLHLNALIAALSPHAWPLFAYFVVAPAQRLYARLTEERWGVPPFAMQRDLNALYVGPAFDVATRAAQMLATAFVALLFSAGLPLLLAMAALAFALSFAVDYFLLLRYYGRPPHRDERLHRKLSRCMPYAILLHLGMAIWMLSNDDLVGKAPTRLDEAAAAAAANSFFSGGDVVTAGIARFTQPHIWPLTLIFLLPLGYIVLSDILPSRQLSALLLGLRAVFMATCYGDGGGRVLGRKRSRRVSSEMQLDVRKDNGYSKVFERPLPPERLAPGPYHPPTSPQADTAGWQEALDEYGVPVLRKLRDGHLQSARSPSIQPYRRTWELLKANGLWSYELHRSPRYRDAVLAFVSDFCPPATSTVGKSLRGSLWAGDGRQAQWQSKMLVMEADEEEQEE